VIFFALVFGVTMTNKQREPGMVRMLTIKIPTY